MQTHFTIIAILTAIVLFAMLLLPGTASAQYPQVLPHQIAPPAPDKIGCYHYTKETGWVSVPCANSSQVESLGPLPTLNSSKRLDINLGISPGKILVNPKTNLVYVGDVSGNSIKVVSGLSNKTVGTITVGESPTDIVINPDTNMIYASNINSGTVSVISGSTNDVVATIPVGEGPDSIAVNTHTNMIYVANVESNTVSAINGTTNKVVATMHPCNLWGTTFAVDESADEIYLTCTGPEGAIDVISGKTNQVIGTIPVGRDPSNLAFDPETKRLYTANNGDYTVAVVSAKDKKLLDTIPVGTFPEYIAVNPRTNMVYVTCFDNHYNNTLYVISGDIDKVVKKVQVGASANYIAVDSYNNVVYVANYVSNALSVISGDSNTVTDTIPVGPNPDFVTIDNATNRVYVSDFRSGISVIPFSNMDLQDAPEFSFAVPVLFVGITSLVVFSRTGMFTK